MCGATRAAAVAGKSATEFVAGAGETTAEFVAGAPSSRKMRAKFRSLGSEAS